MSQRTRQPLQTSLKSGLRSAVLSILTFLARIRLKRLRLFTIGITGSIGKTSVKEALYSVLSTRLRVYRSEKSYNTEFGLPLAILEQSSGFSSSFAWLKTLMGALVHAFFGGRHLQMLLLEMGVDKPGDMVQLLRLVRPQVAVFTNVKPIHLGEGQFVDLEDIFLEKRKLIDALPEKGIAVLNADDPYVVRLKDEVSCRKILYGYSDIADLRVAETQQIRGEKGGFDGLEFTLTYGDQVATGFVPVLGTFQIYVFLPAIAVALTQGFSLEEAIIALKEYRLPPGRMNPIRGIKDTLLIDSSYNASPEAVKEALNVLSESHGRKIAVLGNMNELGDMTEMKHREIGRFVAGRADLFLAVGDSAQWMYEEALQSGFSPNANAWHFETAEAAADFLRGIMEAGDTILVKGSQNRVRLERLVKKLMRDPDRAGELLARQDAMWHKIE